VTAALLIGIGNALRGDDGVGPLLVEEWREEATGREAAGGEAACAVVHQLTPELALAVAEARRVLFVDAWVNPYPSEPWIEPLRPRRDGSADEAGGHGWGPLAVVALAERLYGWRGEAALLRVPAYAFPHGTALSAGLRRCLPLARDRLRGWLRGGGSGGV
jgi:hydrogenase maturation protease